MSPERSSVERARRTRRIEAAALSILAVLPLLPYFTFLLKTGIPRFELIGDLAIVEHATRHVWTGETLVGGPSRFGWSQPGPMFFYFAAPFQAAFAPASTGVYLAATLVNAASVVGIVASARLFARRAHAIAALLVLLAWFVAFGSVAASPWAPFLIVLPLMAFLVNAAMIARGKSAAAYPALVFGMFAAQTHVAAFPLVTVGTIVAVISFFVGARKREASPELTAEKWRMGIAAAIGLILAVPAVVEQIIGAPGNFGRIASFFLDRPAPLVPFGSATQQWMTMMGWLPYRIGRLSLLRDEFVPQLATPDEMYIGEGTFPAVVAGAHVGLGVMCALIAWRRKDVSSLGLLALGALADVLAVVVLQFVVAPTAPYLVFWTCAGSCLVWIGVFSTFFSALGAAVLKSRRVISATATPLIVFGLAAAVVTASLQRYAFAKHPAGLGSHPELRPDIQKAYSGLVDRLRKDGATPVVHPEGLTDIALGFFLDLEKDRIDVRAPSNFRPLLVGSRGEEKLKTLHVWLGAASSPHPLTKCTEVIARSGDLVVLGSPQTLTSCP